jgi:hypothetical protein
MLVQGRGGRRMREEGEGGGGQRKEEAGRWKVKAGRWKEGGRWKEEGGRWKVEGGRWKEERGQKRGSHKRWGFFLEGRDHVPATRDILNEPISSAAVTTSVHYWC